MEESVHGFRRVDAASDARYFVRFLDEIARSGSVQECRRVILEKMKIGSGEHVLDLGCGLGDQTISMARLAGPSGSAVGLDSSVAMVEEATERAAGQNLNIKFVVGDAEKLDFPDECFDACRSERVFMYLDAVRALAEMARVTKHGGRLVVYDLDHDGMSFDSTRFVTTRKIVQFHSDNHRSGIVGRQLPRLFKDTGLTEVGCTPLSLMLPFAFFDHLYSGLLPKACEAGVISPDEADAWFAEMAEAERRGVFLFVVPGFIVSGRKP